MPADPLGQFTTQGHYGRKVTYNDISLDYSSMQVESQVVVAGRQDLKHVYIFTFHGMETRTPLEQEGTTAYAFHALRNRLLAPHKVLKVDELGASSDLSALLECRPAKREQLSSMGDPSISHVCYDVEGGPWPIGFSVNQWFGQSFSYVYQIKVTVSGRDPKSEMLYQIPPVLGFDISTNYGIDENHLTTRRVVGTIYLARVLDDPVPWKQVGTTSFNSSIDSADLRRFLFSSFDAAAWGVMRSALMIHKGMRRIMTDWTFDPSGTEVNFSAIDQEQWRPYPFGVTSGDASFHARYDGVGWGKPMKTALEGTFNGPRTVPKETIMLRVLATANIMMGGVNPASPGTFITAFEYDTSLYHNTITFRFDGMINFGTLVQAGKPVLSAFGLGSLIGQNLDALGNFGEYKAPPLFGTNPLLGDGYAANVASAGEALQTYQTSYLGIGLPMYTEGNLFRERADQLGEERRHIKRQTVQLKPGSIHFTTGENIQVVLGRDFGSDQTGKPAKVVISGRNESMAFVGYRAFSVQEASGNSPAQEPELVAQDEIERLEQHGNFGIAKEKTKDLVKPLEFAQGLQQGRVKKKTMVWILRLNGEAQKNIRDNNANPSRMRAQISKQCPQNFYDLFAFINKLRRGL